MSPLLKVSNIPDITNMYKRSELSTDQDLFSGVTQHLNGTRHKELTDPRAWHNQYYQNITSQVDESIFSCLYASRMGRPNASIRRIVAMIILKEGQNWTDEQLFEQVRYNLKVMRALGLTNLNDEAPSESTYYVFKDKLVQYADRTGEDLFHRLFEQLTTDQVIRYKVSGMQIRMDSKLIH